LDEVDESLVIVEGSTRLAAAASLRGSSTVGSYEAPKHRAASQRHDDEKKYFTDSMPDYENESQIATGVRHRVGARVIHDAFGKGRILAIDGKGENARAIVDFDSVGRKHLMLKFANLRSA
jgi:DNA helicase-2/ATP-dependent DNA helicase PcrA